MGASQKDTSSQVTKKVVGRCFRPRGKALILGLGTSPHPVLGDPGTVKSGENGSWDLSLGFPCS